MTAEVKKRRFAEGTTVSSPTDLSAGGSGSGEKNYILNTSDATNWGESTDGQVDVSTTTTVTELPREFTTESGIKIVGTGSTGTDEYVYYRFSLDDADLNRKLKIAFSQKSIAGYADGELTVEVHYNAQADYLGAYTELTVPNSDINVGDGDAIYTFDTDGTGIYYELRINKPLAATTTGVVISDVVVGPGKVIPGAVITDWESFDFQLQTDNLQPVVGTGGDPEQGSYWRRVGSNLEARIVWRWGDTGETIGSTNYQWDVTQLGLSIDSSQAIPNFESTVGVCRIFDESGTKEYVGTVKLDSGGTFIRFTLVSDVAENTNWQNATPFGVVQGDAMSAWVSIPIADWSNSTVNFINDEVAAQNARFRAIGTSLGVTSGATVVWPTVQYNEGGGSFSSGIYTVPADGKYQVTASLGPNASVGGDINTNIIKNGSGFAQDRSTTGGTDDLSKITSVIDCVAGDTLEIFPSQSFTTDSNSKFSYLEIARVPDFTAGQAVSFGQASAGNYGLVKQNKWQIKTLSSSVTSPTVDISDLKFNNLTIGNLYRVTLCGLLELTGTTGDESVATKIFHDSNVLATIRHRNDGQSDRSNSGQSVSSIFKATATTVTFDFTEAGSGTLTGNGTTDLTFSMLEELANYSDETTDFT